MKLFLQYIKYLVTIQLVSLAITFVLRLLLYWTIDYHFASDISLAIKAVAFVKGLWFDNVICCYIMAVPLITCIVASLFGYVSRWIVIFLRVWLGVFFAFAFALSAANIPYFCYFFQNINSCIFQWFGYAGTTAGMVVGETSYWGPITYGIIAIAGFVYFLVKLPSPRISKSPPLSSKLSALVCGLALMGLCFLGMRGRFGYNPIKVSQAYYCNDAFLNQLGISPTFNLMASIDDDSQPENKHLQLMDEEEAVKAVQKILGRQGIQGVSPIARNVVADSVAQPKKNVVFILMESMSANLVKSINGDEERTPYIDYLYHNGWSFCNMYSAGNHTNHGIYATLYSWPAIMFRNMMLGSVIPHYNGLPTVLHDTGYHNLFFMTHESQYDNMNGFLRTNGFDEIYSQENYPSNKIANSFGVQDDFLYSYAIPVLTKQSKTGQPFFSVLLSISNHPPFVIPSYFHPKSKKKEQQIVEYADWSISQFFKAAQKQPWYKNTIFVLLGDHGKLLNTPECELPESYNHIPLIIYGEGITPRIDTDWAVQEDVAPTILSLLGISYTQNNFGIDLRKERRDCVFYTGDKIVAARDHDHLYMYNPSEKTEMLYKVKGKNSVERVKSTDARFNYLKHYVFSMLQTAETWRHKTK